MGSANVPTIVSNLTAWKNGVVSMARMSSSCCAPLELRERHRLERVRCPPVQVLKALGVHLSLARVECRQRPVDEEDDACLLRAGPLVDSRNDARRQRDERLGLSRRERGKADACFGRPLFGRPGERVFD